MGHDRTNNNAAAIAVILIAGLFFVLIGGAVVFLGGVFFFASSSPEPVTYYYAGSAGRPAKMPLVAPVRVNAKGQIEIEGAIVSLDEFRAHLEDSTEQTQSDPPQLLIHADCPNELSLQVTDVFVEVIGEQPMEIQYETSGTDL